MSTLVITKSADGTVRVALDIPALLALDTAQPVIVPSTVAALVETTATDTAQPVETTDTVGQPVKVQRLASRSWAIVDTDGQTVQTFGTKRAADAALLATVQTTDTATDTSTKSTSTKSSTKRERKPRKNVGPDGLTAGQRVHRTIAAKRGHESSWQEARDLAIAQGWDHVADSITDAAKRKGWTK